MPLVVNPPYICTYHISCKNKNTDIIQCFFTYFQQLVYFKKEVYLFDISEHRKSFLFIFLEENLPASVAFINEIF